MYATVKSCFIDLWLHLIYIFLLSKMNSFMCCIQNHFLSKFTWIHKQSKILTQMDKNPFQGGITTKYQQNGLNPSRSTLVNSLNVERSIRYLILSHITAIYEYQYRSKPRVSKPNKNSKHIHKSTKRLRTICGLKWDNFQVIVDNDVDNANKNDSADITLLLLQEMKTEGRNLVFRTQDAQE